MTNEPLLVLKVLREQLHELLQVTAVLARAIEQIEALEEHESFSSKVMNELAGTIDAIRAGREDPPVPSQIGP